MVRRLAVFIAIVVAVHADAATIDRVRQRLSELRGSAAVAGTLRIDEKETRQGKERAANHAAEIACESGTVRISVPAHDGAPDRSIGLGDAWKVLHAADALLGRLKKATVKGEAASNWRGQPVTRIELAIAPDFGDNPPPKMLKFNVDSTATLWVAGDGTPLAVEWRDKVRARLLVMSAQSEQKSTTEYALAGDHLVALRTQEEMQGSGFGESGQEKRTITLAIRK